MTYLTFGNHIMPWTRHVRAGQDLVRRAFEAANKVGDLTCAVYCCKQMNVHLLAAGDPLAETQREAENGLAFMQKTRFGFVIDVISAQLGLIRTLRGLTPKFGSFDDDQFDELRFERHFADDPEWALGECWYWIRKLQARFFAGDYPAAVEASSQAQRLLWTSHRIGRGGVSLLRRAVPRRILRLRRGRPAAASRGAGRPPPQLEVWAENCPENFENRAALVGAEIARIEGRELDAEHLYEQAIRSARANGFVHNEALAYELAARFYAARGFEQDRGFLPAECPVRLLSLGGRWQGAAAR